MWGMETLKKLKQKAGSRETEPSAGAAPAQGAASSTAPDASPVSARQVLAKFTNKVYHKNRAVERGFSIAFRIGYGFTLISLSPAVK